MAAAISPTRDPMKRRLSIDAEDELFKSLQGVQELNNSQRKGRTVIGSPGNHSGRMNRRSIDGLQSPGKHGSRRERRSIDGAASPGLYAARRQARRGSMNGSSNLSPKRNNSGRRSVNPNVSPKRNNSGRRSANPNVSPKRNNSGRRGARSTTPPKPEPLALEERQASGGTVRKANRRRRASTGMDSPGTLSGKGRTVRRSNPNVKQQDAPEPPLSPKGRTKNRSPSPKPSTGASQAVVRSFHRRRIGTSTSPKVSPTSSPTSPKATTNVYSTSQTTPTRSPKDSKMWKEMTMRANLLKSAKPPRLNESATSWASFDDDIVGSDVEKEDVSDSERTGSTKPNSDRTQESDRSENRDLKNLLEQLKDPAEMERRRLEREQLGLSQRRPALEHDKVAEKASSRNLKTFLQRSKRGYGQQANLDGLSVMQ